MKPRLLILSDLWGFEKPGWVKNYLNILNPEFEIKLYDCRDIGNIDKCKLTEQDLHSQFVSHGIDTAIEKLMVLEPNKVDIIAFSIGGTIAWKAGLKGLKINNLYAVSSTRLRYETEKPNCKIKLIFGEMDRVKPNVDWFDTMHINAEIIKEGDHEIYRDKNLAIKLSKDLKSKFKITS